MWLGWQSAIFKDSHCWQSEDVVHLHSQVEKQALDAQMEAKTAEAGQLHSSLQQSSSESQKLSQGLSETQAELRSSVEETKQKEQLLQQLRLASAAREAELAAELEASRIQSGQLGRQLSERIQRLDTLQVSWSVVRVGTCQFHTGALADLLCIALTVHDADACMACTKLLPAQSLCVTFLLLLL